MFNAVGAIPTMSEKLSTKAHGLKKENIILQIQLQILTVCPHDTVKLDEQDSLILVSICVK
jgi:hypothetical protein